MFVVGWKDNHSTFNTKFLKTSRVYQSRPRPFGCASRIDPKMVRKSPPPDICQPRREPVNNGLNTGLGAMVWAATTASAVRRASVVAVREGFAEPMTGNTAGPATYTFAILWNLPDESVTDWPGLPIHSVPASWWVLP